jgi:hypothetical protein
MTADRPSATTTNSAIKWTLKATKTGNAAALIGYFENRQPLRCHGMR